MRNTAEVAVVEAAVSRVTLKLKFKIAFNGVPFVQVILGDLHEVIAVLSELVVADRLAKSEPGGTPAAVLFPALTTQFVPQLVVEKFHDSLLIIGGVKDQL
jgi:hypothetical protein